MLKSEALVLFRNLNSLGGLKGVRFSYAVAKNLNTLKSEIESLEKSMEAPKEFQEYEAKRIALVEKHADKDKDGKPIKETAENGSQQYVVKTNEKVFLKEFETLKKGNKKEIEARQKQIEEYTELLETESGVKVHKIKLEDVPTDIATEQMAGLYDIILEE